MENVAETNTDLLAPQIQENIYIWRRGLAAAASNQLKSIEHLGLITCDKIQSKNIISCLGPPHSK